MLLLGSALLLLALAAGYRLGLRNVPVAGRPVPAAGTPVSGVMVPAAPVGRAGRLPRRRGFGGTLTLQVANPESARAAVEQVLRTEVDRWQIEDVVPARNGKITLRYVVRLDQGRAPDQVLSTLFDHAAPHVLTAALH